MDEHAKNHFPFSLDVMASISLLVSPDCLSRIQTQTNSVDDYYTTCLGTYAETIKTIVNELLDGQHKDKAAMVHAFRRFVDESMNYIEQQAPKMPKEESDDYELTDDEDATSIKQLSIQL